ncbi:preprotein translocase subunit YajC [Portibacter lacus]|uniref:Sec translocon accessory complex subunit YajC n=1 Tax=Portibacter lacus TaxID=1099794 RepID=A0AA37SPL7_9BACT|nr:preprotein translocase subunit YajC [Portibacter lacus]GLR16491.1 preprotein translocase subunit YajC [Portibacter lacus]
MVFLQAGGGSQGIFQLVIFGAIFLVFYLFFIRPQAQKQKAQGNFVNDLQKGDEIVTGSGIIGKINKIDDKVIHLQIDQKTFLKIMKSSVSKELTDALNAKVEEKK